jgi:hypothetical protein
MHGPSSLASRGADAHAGVVNVTRIERPMAEFSPEPVPTTFFVPLDGSSVAELALPVARVVSTGFGASLRVENVPAEPDDPTKDGIGEFLATASTDQNDTVVCLACRGLVEQPPVRPPGPRRPGAPAPGRACVGRRPALLIGIVRSRRTHRRVSRRIRGCRPDPGSSSHVGYRARRADPPHPRDRFVRRHGRQRCTRRRRRRARPARIVGTG